MRDDVGEWIAKAEGDFGTVWRELRARLSPNYDSACFHAQQCAEKYLKAAMLDARLPIPRIHDLQELLEALLSLHPEWELFRLQANKLTQYAVFFRYPGRCADRGRAKEALSCCALIREHVRASVGLPNADRRARRTLRSLNPKPARRSSRKKKR